MVGHDALEQNSETVPYKSDTSLKKSTAAGGGEEGLGDWVVINLAAPALPTVYSEPLANIFSFRALYRQPHIPATQGRLCELVQYFALLRLVTLEGLERFILIAGEAGKQGQARYPTNSDESTGMANLTS